MRRDAACADAPRDFVAPCGRRLATGQGGVIAEITKASHTRECIREHFMPFEIATGLARPGRQR